ncbi:MerR family transcriptional regulator [Alteromonas sp. 5E99-2]|uniref:MerR family transcriptional regulator n=1 Tax=Alteromonas sp. 5E99-2 TaxID=2817683 RepID=UPI001A994F76|nr:MerR family transcriptional regulator [Alteromonas sp. 5E99-2]MBO1254998.1 MerR family transcriptional regulator [Alteromonas sp. 5E99-2]
MFIGQAAKLSGATQRAIRLYESLGLLKVSRDGRYRVYSAKNIETIKIIKGAQALGIHLSEIMSLLDEKGEFDWTLANEFLSAKYAMIESEISELENKKINIENYQKSITNCLKGLDSNP